MIVLEQVSASQSHQYSSQDVAFVGGAGGCARVSEGVGCTYVDGMLIFENLCVARCRHDYGLRSTLFSHCPLPHLFVYISHHALYL